MAEVSTGKLKERFDLLDGIRGAAALAVMIHHYTEFEPVKLFGNAFAAVDIFFILSGFVVAHSYGGKIRDGMSFLRFAFLRLVRLYPLFLIGLTCGLIAVFGQLNKVVSEAEYLTKVGQAFTLNIFMMPYLGDLSIPYDRAPLVAVAFPSNSALWSLFFETFVSLAFFAFVARFKKIHSAVIAVVGMLLFFAAGVYFGQPNPGWGGINLLGGFPRVIGEFALGTVIYVNRDKFGTTPTWVIALMSCVVFCSFFVSFKGSWILYDLAIYPIFVLLACRKTVTGIAKSLSSALGKLSYPLYIIHMPVYFSLFEVFGFSKLSPWLTIPISAIVSLLCAAGLYKIDEKFRAKLTAACMPSITTLEARFRKRQPL